MRPMLPSRNPIATAMLVTVLATAPVVDAVGREFTNEDFKLDSTEDLLDICTVEPSDPSHWAATAFCYGFFQGAMHYHDALARGGAEFAPIICPAEPLTVREVVTTFVTYAQANPKFLAEPPIDTAFRAVAEKWPCG